MLLGVGKRRPAPAGSTPTNAGWRVYRLGAALRRKRRRPPIGLLGIQYQLRTAEQGNRLAGFLVLHDGIPDLRRFAEMHWPGGAEDGALSSGPQVVGLELNGGKARGSRRKIGDASITGAGIGQRDDAAGVQKTIGRHERFFDCELGSDLGSTDMSDDDAQEVRQFAGTDFIETIRSQHSGGYARARVRSRPSATNASPRPKNTNSRPTELNIVRL